MAPSSTQQHTWTRFSKRQTPDIQGVGFWSRFWMKFAWSGYFGYFAVATWTAPPYRQRRRLARYHTKGYISPSANICYANVQQS